MPKELVYPLRLFDNDEVKIVPQVSWGHDTEVQLATVNLDEDELDERRGWFATLSRAQINALIRTLRKARDQAYGADA